MNLNTSSAPHFNETTSSDLEQMASSTFASYLRSVTPETDMRIILSDFDGTLTRKDLRDSENFKYAARNVASELGALLSHPAAIAGVVTARSFGEVRSIIEDSFAPQGLMTGFSSPEHGSAIFCSRLEFAQEELLRSYGFRVLTPGEIHTTKFTVIKLGEYDANYIRDEVVLPTIREFNIPAVNWASSFTHTHDRGDLLQLQRLSGHDTIEDTARSIERFGSGYIKINGYVNSSQLVEQLMNRASDKHIYALPTAAHPDDSDHIQTVDFSAGTDKRDALKAISDVYSILTGRAPETLPIYYFGDGQNDLPAYRFLAERPGRNAAFMVGEPGHDNTRLISDIPGVTYLKDSHNIAGVRRGLEMAMEQEDRFRLESAD